MFCNACHRFKLLNVTLAFNGCEILIFIFMQGQASSPAVFQLLRVQRVPCESQERGGQTGRQGEEKGRATRINDQGS